MQQTDLDTTTACDQRLCAESHDSPTFVKLENNNVPMSNSGGGVLQLDSTIAALSDASSFDADVQSSTSAALASQANGLPTSTSVATSSTPVGSLAAAATTAPVSSSQQLLLIDSTVPPKTLSTTSTSGVTQQSASTSTSTYPTNAPIQPKRLHVSNIPFRFRDPDLRTLFGVSVSVLCVCVQCPRAYTALTTHTNTC